jgi:hypothetical protein
MNMFSMQFNPSSLWQDCFYRSFNSAVQNWYTYIMDIYSQRSRIPLCQLYSDHLILFFWSGGDNQESSEEKAPKTGRVFHMKRRTKIRAKVSSKKGIIILFSLRSENISLNTCSNISRIQYLQNSKFYALSSSKYFY